MKLRNRLKNDSLLCKGVGVISLCILGLSFLGVSNGHKPEAKTPSQPVDQQAKKEEDSLKIRYLGKLTVENEKKIGKTQIGGLSGITYDRQRNLFYTVVDGSQDGGQRFYIFRLIFEKGKPRNIQWKGVRLLRNSQGKILWGQDTEGIAFTKPSWVWISNEGGNGEPWIKRFNIATGNERETCVIPNEFLPEFESKEGEDKIQIKGIVKNLAFESLTLTPDGKHLFSANEQALVQDNNEWGLLTVRIVKLGKVENKWKRVEEKLYRVDFAGFFESLSDLVALDNNGTLLALERRVKALDLSGKWHYGFRLCKLDFNEKDVGNVLGMEQLSKEGVKLLGKKIVFDSADEGVGGIDNAEGMCLGPVIQGTQTLVIVTDNNFMEKQATQIHVLGWDIK